MAGIRDRVDDALLLWEYGRREGAFLCALVAFAATARRRYPKMSDRGSFERFLADSHKERVSVEYRGRCHPIETIMYKWLRCQLVHEGETPVDLKFMDEQEPGGTSVRAGGAPEYILKIGFGWFDHMFAQVCGAPENSGEFADLLTSAPDENPPATQ